jgi:hypothetical protein
MILGERACKIMGMLTCTCDTITEACFESVYRATNQLKPYNLGTNLNILAKAIYRNNNGHEDSQRVVQTIGSL